MPGNTLFLYVQVLIGITLGVLIGHFYPDTGVALKPLGDRFIKLIKMTIAPIIFGTIVVGIARMGDMKAERINDSTSYPPLKASPACRMPYKGRLISLFTLFVSEKRRTDTIADIPTCIRTTHATHP